MSERCANCRDAVESPHDAFLRIVFPHRIAKFRLCRACAEALETDLAEQQEGPPGSPLDKAAGRP